MERWTHHIPIRDIQELFHKAYAADERLGIHFAAAQITMENLQEHLISTPLFVTQTDGRVASTVAVRFPWSKNASPFLVPHLGWVATHPEFQGRGYAKNLITQVISYLADDLKVPAVTLGTAKEHPWLMKSYEKLGFNYLTEVQKFADHKTVYMIKILKRDSLLALPDNELVRLVKERGL